MGGRKGTHVVQCQFEYFWFGYNGFLNKVWSAVGGDQHDPRLCYLCEQSKLWYSAKEHRVTILVQVKAKTVPETEDMNTLQTAGTASARVPRYKSSVYERGVRFVSRLVVYVTQLVVT